VRPFKGSKTKSPMRPENRQKSQIPPVSLTAKITDYV
jgi:hypothetical protein